VYGPWDYADRTQQFPYEDTASYEIAGEWLSGHGLVEDWGCGVGWASRYIEGTYRGVDGAWSRWADEVVDLREYRSDVGCALMRHVLEHNADWRQIAENFTDSWHDRAALVMFIPPQVEEVDTGDETWAVPDIAVSGPDLFEILGRHGTRFEYHDLTYPPEHSMQWGWEGVILMDRP
jgi:hypothetical protein